jgi:hypothetical protein
VRVHDAQWCIYILRCVCFHLSLSFLCVCVVCVLLPSAPSAAFEWETRRGQRPIGGFSEGRSSSTATASSSNSANTGEGEGTGAHRRERRQGAGEVSAREQAERAPLEWRAYRSTSTDHLADSQNDEHTRMRHDAVSMSRFASRVFCSVCSCSVARQAGSVSSP